MTTQNNSPSGQESSQFTLGDSPDRRESTAASGVLPTTSSSSPGGVTYRPVKRSPMVCPSCGGKKAAHAVSCRACRTKQEQATKVALVCEQCSSPFLRPAGEHTKRIGRGAGNHTFCSAECSRAWRKVQAAQPHGSCANCSAPLVKRFQQHYCSPACYHAARPRQTEAYNGVYLSLKRQVLERDGHQCVMTGKTRMLEAHHIDHDPTNNVLTNLISLSRPAHEFYHSLRAGPQAALRSWFEEKVK